MSFMAILTGCTPVWLRPEYNPEAQLALGIAPASLQAAFDRLAAHNIAPKAVLAVSPSYFGSCSDVKGWMPT